MKERFDVLPSYHLVENTDGIIDNPVDDYLEDYTIYGGSTGTNLISLPYYSLSGLKDGVQFDISEDGTITLNGTATASIYFGVKNKTNDGWEITEKGYYEIFGLEPRDDISLQGLVDGNWGKLTTVTGDHNICTFDTSITAITLQIKAGTVCDNVVIKPRLEKVGVGDLEELVGKYYVHVSNGVYGNLITMPNGTAKQLNDYYAVYNVSLAGDEFSKYFIKRNFDKCKGEIVKCTCSLDSDAQAGGYSPSIYFFYDENVDGNKNYIVFERSKQYKIELPNADPIRIEFRAYSNDASKKDTSVTFSNFSMTVESIESNSVQIELDKPILPGKSISFKKDNLEKLSIGKHNKITVDTEIQPTETKYCYYTY